jgi:hypothetical protein
LTIRDITIYGGLRARNSFGASAEHDASGKLDLDPIFRTVIFLLRTEPVSA